MFKDGAAIECFIAGEEAVKGVLISLDGKIGEFRLFAPDFPDWIEDDGVGVKLSPESPLLIDEFDSTTVVPPDGRVRLTTWDTIEIELE